MPKKMCASIAGGALGFLLAATAAYADTYTVTTAADRGEGSLRWAIHQANKTELVRDVIVFKIPGAGSHIIQLQSPLPPITDAVTIDGYTQDGASPNTEANGNNAVLLIVLNGAAAGDGADGLRINATGTTVRGLAIQGFSIGSGVVLGGTGGHVISGNYIGADDFGEANAFGVLVRPGSSDNTIGGSTPGARNVISGNTGAGVGITEANRTIVEGNFIGPDKTGKLEVGNGTGISISKAEATRIGGTSSGQRNVISGNNGAGVYSRGGSEQLILGNFIGTDVAGTGALGNEAQGIMLDGAQLTVVGQTAAGAGNIIENNRVAGVSVFGSTSLGNAIRGNRIFKNGRLGIELVDPVNEMDDGVTPNDPAPDDDPGPNRLQNFPILTDVEATGAGITVSGVLNSVPNTTFFIDFYANEERDPSGHGEGQFYLGTIEVTTDGQGVRTFDADFAAPPGPWISATATRKARNADTSEFSPHVKVPGRKFGVRNTNPDGPESFAQALLDSNAAGNPNAVNEIVFDIAGLGPYVISVPRPLFVRAPVHIDGNSQPGAIPNSDPTGFNGNVAIVLDGSAAPSPVLIVASNSVTIEGLSIVNNQPPNRFGALQVSGDGNWFGGNLFGSWPDDTPGPNRFGAVVFGDDNRFGGYSLGGNSDLRWEGRNIFSSNQLPGAGIAGRGNVLDGNFIGTDFTGTQDRGNGEWGVSTSETGEDISITQNVIAFNALGGVELAASSSIVSQNSMFDNGGLAIDIPPAGANPNVPGGSQNYPVLTFAFMERRSITIGGTLDGPPNTPMVVEFFASPSCDPSGHGEGKTFLGSIRVRTDETGHKEFERRVPRQGLQAPQEITAVTGVGWYALSQGTRFASPHSANTSEFAACLLAQ